MNRQFVSYPKSGRSWVRYALHELGVANAIVFQHDTFEFNDGAKPPHLLDFRTRVLRYVAVDRVVYMERDPRDVMVSLFHQVTGRFKDFFAYEGSISDFIRDDYFGAENLRVFRDQWEEMCRRGIALRISYEECHADFADVLARLVEYYGFNVSDEAIAFATERARIENMREVEQAGSFPEPWLRPRQGATKVRVGVVGGYASALEAADIAYLDAVFGLAEEAPAEPLEPPVTGEGAGRP